MDDKTRQAIEDVLNYLWDDEAEDFAENGGEGAHIFTSLVTLREALDS